MANPETIDPHRELKDLIEASEHNELECKNYLKYAKDKLVSITVSKYIDEAEEYRGHSGDSDYIVVCAGVDDAGIESNQAFIWETKSPQCFLFECDTENRVKPTKEFISAENQLLHYYEECQGSNQFKEEFKILHPEDVKLGGIIIGSQRTQIKNGDRYSGTKADTLFKRALNLRKRHLYGNSGIRVITWDSIVNFLGKNQPARQNYEEIEVPISIPIKPSNTIIQKN